MRVITQAAWIGYVIMAKLAPTWSLFESVVSGLLV